MDQDHNHNRHIWLMALACLVPLAILAVLWASGVQLGNLALVAMVLVCPLTHLFIMRGMGHEQCNH